MEKKLQEYRAEQEKLKKVQQIKDNVKNIFSFFKLDRRLNIPDEKKSKNHVSSKLTQLKKRRTMVIPAEKKSLIDEDVISIDEESLSDDDSIWCCSWVQLFYYCLCFTLWLIIYMIFIKFQFGTVYLILSALVFMYLNTGTAPKKSGEISAYSVFNKDCASIDGTLKAEQFEREIMFGAGSVR